MACEITYTGKLAVARTRARVIYSTHVMIVTCVVLIVNCMLLVEASPLPCVSVEITIWGHTITVYTCVYP